MCYCVAVKSLNLIVELAVTSLCIWNNELGEKLFCSTSYKFECFHFMLLISILC